MRARKLFLIFLVLTLSAASLAGSLVGKKAPAINIRQWLTDNPPDTETLSGRVYLIEFWATWCHSCVESIPHLIALNNKFKDKGLVFISISVDTSARAVTEMVGQKRINYAVALDGGATDDFAVNAFPTIVLVDHQGKIVWQGYPWSDDLEEQLKKTLQAAPPSLLAGIDLGPFDNLRNALIGGHRFAEAYNKLCRLAVDGTNKKHSAAAKHIIETIDTRLSENITAADKLRTTDPEKAYGIYAEVVARYDGIELVAPAKAACLELERDPRLFAKKPASPI